MPDFNYTVTIEPTTRMGVHREPVPTFLVCVYKEPEHERVRTIDNTTDRDEAERWAQEERDFYMAEGHTTDHYEVYRLGQRVFLKIVHLDGRHVVPYRYLPGSKAVTKQDLLILENRLKNLGLEKYEDVPEMVTNPRWYRLCGKYRRIA